MKRAAEEVLNCRPCAKLEAAPAPAAPALVVVAPTTAGAAAAAALFATAGTTSDDDVTPQSLPTLSYRADAWWWCVWEGSFVAREY